jgi:alcohol dehydrogenase class IV
MESHLERKLGPLMLWGLGVGYVISGMYFGWNLGLPAGGTGGMAIATFFIIIMYVTFTFSYTELACAIPTTSGTGSEVGRSTVISEDESKRKRILFSPRLLAEIVFADPMLTMELPSGITAATGMDALTHNLEAFVAKGFSPLCDGIAIEAVRLIKDSLVKASTAPDLESRSKMQMAALMGATSFQKGLGVVHSLAHPLSTKFDMHHGVANAVMLPYGMKFNEQTSKDRYDFLAKTIGVSDLRSWVLELNQQLNIPENLNYFNITKEAVNPLSDLALADVCHQCNPRACSLEDFQAMYNEAIQ